MPRTIDSALATILAGDVHGLDHTLTLTFPDATVMRLATSPLTIGTDVYTNDLEAVSEIRQTLESPADVVSVAIQNKDRSIGQHFAANWQKWQQAEAVLGRQYSGQNLTAWIECFRGVVQQPAADDMQLKFDIVHDTISPGQIVCSRSLATLCGFRFKDAKTCGYVGSETDCNHHLKSAGGCDGRNNAHRFGGFEHRYLPQPEIPGTGGNPDIPPDGGGHCPRLDQFVLVRGNDGEPSAKMAGLLTESDELFNPISGRFHRIRFLRLVNDFPVYRLRTSAGAESVASASHPVIRSAADTSGVAMCKLRQAEAVLTFTDGQLQQAEADGIERLAEPGDVLWIELEDGHIYASGNDTRRFVVCHNLKDDGWILT